MYKYAFYSQIFNFEIWKKTPLWVTVKQDVVPISFCYDQLTTAEYINLLSLTKKYIDLQFIGCVLTPMFYGIRKPDDSRQDYWRYN